MKTFLSIIALIAASTLFTQAQTIQTLVLPTTASGPDRLQDIPVLAGETLEVLTWGSETFSVNQSLKADGQTVVRGPLNSSPRPSVVIAGPRTVTLVVPSNTTSVFTYKLTTNSAVATQNVASTTIVIPANAPAPVDIILESSTDLITWTAALPGSYPADTSKRFFRVRAVAH